MRLLYSGFIIFVLCMTFIGNGRDLVDTEKKIDNITGLDTTAHGDRNIFPVDVSLPHSGFEKNEFSQEGNGQSDPSLYIDRPEKSLPKIRPSKDVQFDYEVTSPYYKVSFKGGTFRIDVAYGWIEFILKKSLSIARIDETSMTEEPSIRESSVSISDNSISISDVFEATDLSYSVETSALREALTLKQFSPFERVIQNISWHGLMPEFQEDGSIVFSSEKPVLKIFPPTMTDAEGSTCSDLHYELVETENGYELHKIIEEKGLEWLQKAVYPVVVDPSMETFEDAWESSGFKPYGQYFQNTGASVSALNGHVNIAQTDLVIPGRGLDLVVSRIYETPAVFHQAEPYDYTPSPVNIGKGWKLDFPWISDDYLYLWSGTAYKIQWANNTFENHVGGHFTLVKNPDDTNTLIMADGTVYEFSSGGKITEIRDLDQNTITFNHSGEKLTSITDTIGRIVTFEYSDGYLKKIVYNNAEIEYGYNSYGNLVWADDMLDRRTCYCYDLTWTELAELPGSEYYYKYNVYLLSQIVYPTGGYSMYSYNRFSYNDVYGGSGLDYYKYYITDERVYETTLERHAVYSFYGSFQAIADCIITIKDGFDVTQGIYNFNLDVNSSVVTQLATKNSAGTTILKYRYSYNSRKETTEVEVYNDGTNLSYTNYFAYDNWGNMIYTKDAVGYEQFFSYANTSTSGFFIDKSGTVVQVFTNGFSNDSVPDSVHTALLGTAEKRDGTFVKEAYLSYDSEAHSTQHTSLFGNYTVWLTFSGIFDEKTGSTNFPIDLTGHTVAGNAVLQITGSPSSDTYTESHAVTCSDQACTWCPECWSGEYYRVRWVSCGHGIPLDCDEGYKSVGPFVHHPKSLGYQKYTTDPAMSGSQCSQKSKTLTVTTYWKAYPSRVDYNLDGSSWENITTNLRSSTTKIAVPISDDSHTLNFAESSSQKTKFSWTLYVPVDSVPEAYITTYAYDTYGNVISVTSPDAVTVTMSYSGDYSHAYRTEMSTVAGSDTIIHKAAYDYYKGWITSRQNPDGTEYRFYYDLLGRIIKREYPLLSGQSERSYEQAIYDDANNIVILIDTSGHYVTKHFDKLGRLTATKICSGTYGSGALYSTVSLAYRFDSRAVSVTDAENNTSTYSYDFLGRCTQKTAPDSAVVCYSYDDTNNKITFTSPTGFDTVQWFDWGGRLVKMEEEYAADSFAVTTYQYNEIGQVTSITDAENHVTSFFYESPFGLTKRSFPDGTYEEFKYDDAGSLVFSKDRGKNQTTIMYDAICRVTQVHYYDQSTTTLAYDLNSNVIQVIDNSPTPGDYIEYEYDTWNRVVKETKHISSQTYTVEAEYNTASQITKLTYPDSMQILYTYTDLGGIAEIKRYIDGVNDEILMHNTQHSIKGLLTQFEYGNGLAARFSYDDRDRLLTIDIESGETSYLDLGYAHDNKSNVTQIVNGWRDVQSNWHSQTESFTYDGLNRLMSADCASWSHTYSYDKTGNRTAKDRITYTVNAMGEVTALSDGTTFTYNSIGSRTGKTTGSDSWVYMYNALNQLTQIEKNGETLGEYVYDGNGRRIQVTENGETTTYAYFGRVLMYEENAVGFATYIHGPGGKVAKRTTIDGESHIFFYHADHLGSTRLVTDETATIVTAVAYHPFGEIDIQEGAEKYLFSGNEIDATGLYYFGARYYDAELGRFLTVDPIPGSTASSQSMNRYNYCMNNPVSYTDPWGERPDIPSDVRDFWHSAWDLVYLLPHKVYLGPQASADSSDINKTLGVIVVSFLQEGTTVYYEGEQYTLWSPAIRKGNVAIAIANRNSLICYNYQQGVGVNPEPVPIYQGEPGLLIFFFGEDGSVEDIQFIPFKDLPESYGDDLGDALADAVNKMLDYTNGDTAILSDIIWALKGVCKLKMGDVEGALELFGKAGLVLDTADLSETFGLIPEVPGPVGWTLTFLDKANRAIWDYWDEMFKALDCLQFYLQMRL